MYITGITRATKAMTGARFQEDGINAEVSLLHVHCSDASCRFAEVFLVDNPECDMSVAFDPATGLGRRQPLQSTPVRNQ